MLGKLTPRWWLVAGRLCALFYCALYGCAMCHCAPCKAEDPWRDALPEGWFATLSAPDPAAAEASFTRLAGDLGLPGADRFQEARRLLGLQGAPSSGAALVLGVAEGPGGGAPYPFALLPIALPELTHRLGGESVGEVALVRLLGAEFTAAPWGPWTFLAPSDQSAHLTRVRGLAPPDLTPPPAEPTSLRLDVSSRGLDSLAALVAERSERESLTGRLLLERLAWPPNRRWLDAALVLNRSVARRLAEGFSQVSIEVAAPADRPITLTLTGVTRGEGGAGAPGAPGSQPPYPDAGRAAILQASGAEPLAAHAPLLRLALAYSQGRPDAMGLERYPSKDFATLGRALEDAMGLIRAGATLTWLPGPEDPLQSNRAAVVAVDDPAEFLEACDGVLRAWNALIERADPPTQMTFDVAPCRLAGREGRGYSVDMAEAVEREPSDLVRGVMRRFFGDDGVSVVRVVPLDGGRVLLTDATEETAGAVLAAALAGDASTGEEPAGFPGEGATAAAAPVGWRGVLHLDRYAALEDRVRSEVMGDDVVGARKPTPMAAATLRFLVTRDGPSHRVLLSLEHEDLRNAVAYLLAK